MRKTKEIGVKGLMELLEEFLRENVVGIVEEKRGNSLIFTFPCGRKFQVAVMDKQRKNNF